MASMTVFSIYHKLHNIYIYIFKDLFLVLNTFLKFLLITKVVERLKFLILNNGNSQMTPYSLDIYL